MSDYLLTIQFRFKAFDDIEARMKAYEELTNRDMISGSNVLGDVDKERVKLQEIRKDSVPRKIEL